MLHLVTPSHKVKNEDGNVSKCVSGPIVCDWRDTKRRCRSAFDQFVTVMILKNRLYKYSSCRHYVMKTGGQQVHALSLFFEDVIIHTIKLAF